MKEEKGKDESFIVGGLETEGPRYIALVKLQPSVSVYFKSSFPTRVNLVVQPGRVFEHIHDSLETELRQIAARAIVTLCRPGRICSVGRILPGFV